jgi:hypothetical protein
MMVNLTRAHQSSRSDPGAEAGVGDDLARVICAPKWMRIVHWTLGLAATVLAFAGFWRNRAVYLRTVDNSDLLFYADLCRDMVQGQYPMKGWNPPSAPFFFPDMIASFASFLVMPNLASGYCLFAGFMIAALLACLYWAAGDYQPARSPRALVVGIAAVALFALSFAGNSGFWGIFRWMIVPNAHGGGAVTGIVLIGLGMRLLEQPSRNRFITFALLSCLAITSDFIVLPHYLIPLLIGGVYQWLRRRGRISTVLLMIAIVLAVSFGADTLVKYIARRVGVAAHPIAAHPITWADFVANWNRFRRDVWLIAGPGTALFVLLGIGVAGACAAIATARRSLVGMRLQLLGVIAVMSCLAALAAPVPFDIWANIDCSRYLLPLLVMPLLLLIVAGLVFLRRIPPLAWTTVAALGLACTILVSLPALRGSPVDHATVFYTAEVQFVDTVARKHHLHAGYANYWQCRPINMFSRENIVASDLRLEKGDLEAFSWMNNPNRWARKPRRDGSGFPIYDFCIVFSDVADVIRAQCGPPAAVEQGFGLTMLVYNRPQDVMFRNIGRARAEFAAHIPPPRKVLPPYLAMNYPRASGAPWSIAGSIELPPDGLELHLSGTGGGDFMDVSANQPNAYELTFQQGRDIVATQRLDAINASGLHARGISLVPILGGRPFDIVRIRATGARDHPTVAHLFVFDDPILHPESER